MQEKRSKKTDIAERVLRLVQILGVTPHAFAVALGYTRSQTVYDIINGRSSPSYDFFRKLARSKYAEAVNLSWLITGRGEVLTPATSAGGAYPQAADGAGRHAADIMWDYGVRKAENLVPLYEIATAAALRLLLAGQRTALPVSYIALPDVPSCDGAVRIWDESFAPQLRRGDVVLFERVDRIGREGMHLVCLSEGGRERAVLGRLEPARDGRVRLTQHGEPAPRDLTAADIRAAARIVACVCYHTWE